MHDCREFDDGLVDLVFDALEIDEKRRRLSEIESCDRCLSEYRSVTKSLLVFDQAVEASISDETYWRGHHEGLRGSLARYVQTAKAVRIPFWRRGLSAKISLPVPAAAVIAIALLLASVFAVRRSTVNVTAGLSQTPPAIDSGAKIIQVPVVQEKVVFRTVYVVKKLKGYEGRRLRGTNTTGKGAASPSQTFEKESGEGGLFTRANLTDFQPPDQMRIRILKRSNSDEN